MCALLSMRQQPVERSATISSDALVATIRAELRKAANPARAPQMQAYMKSSMPYLGVRVPDVRRLTRAGSKLRPFAGLDEVVRAVRTLWMGAEFREERYAATALLDTSSARALRGPELLELHRDLIISGAWWDHVDELSHRVGELLIGWPHQVRPTIREWTTADDHWLRRSSIICQLGHKGDTDLELLTEAIDANATEPGFFLRKAIGWALREYARTDPEWVRAFVNNRELSPLSRREALKRL
jgi:3-methyladenine DNA glycosylase AlkD